MYLHKSYPITIENAKDYYKERLNLETGANVIGGFIQIDNKNNLGAGFSNISIKSGGTTLVDPVHIDAWQQRQGGSYMDSIKPFIITDKDVEFYFEADNTTTGEVKLQLVLVYNCQK